LSRKVRGKKFFLTFLQMIDESNLYIHGNSDIMHVDVFDEVEECV